MAKLEPNKKPKKKKVEIAKSVTDDLSSTKVTTHNLSITTPPTHNPSNRLTASVTEFQALDFVFGYNFPDNIHTTGKHTHSDFQKTFNVGKK